MHKAFIKKHKKAVHVCGLLLGSLLFFLTIYSCLGWHSFPAKMLNFAPGQTETDRSSAATKTNIDGYTTFQSPKNVRWYLGKSKQKLRISNPAGGWHETKKGRKIWYDNNIDMAAQVYIDFNQDHIFSPQECVYNPISYNADGTPASSSKLIAPGHKLTSIQLSEPLSGLKENKKYDAQLLFTPLDSIKHTVTNGVSMAFKIYVAKKSES